MNEYYNRKKSMGKALIPKRKLLDLYKNMPIFKDNYDLDSPRIRNREYNKRQII